MTNVAKFVPTTYFVLVRRLDTQAKQAGASVAALLLKFFI